ncbi:hypothetical protein [Poseidonocella sp. HB161398]|uniref:hypothetical protein n=1 Tax=Poseidonocella sp. HB161398 TaxID=2320855 RepID=UPI00110A0590|nr:hypothetical protein [Poseidonocella sp. HB161398]
MRFDSRKLADLYRTMGEIGAENVLCDTMEELTIQLVRIEKLGRRAKFDDVREIAERIAPKAEQIGLAGLGNVARAVADCVRNGDLAGFAATLARLSRMGDKSLSAIWDPQGMML